MVLSPSSSLDETPKVLLHKTQEEILEERLRIGQGLPFPFALKQAECQPVLWMHFEFHHSLKGRESPLFLFHVYEIAIPDVHPIRRTDNLHWADGHVTGLE